jgi:hypothetical protein
MVVQAGAAIVFRGRELEELFYPQEGELVHECCISRTERTERTERR